MQDKFLILRDEGLEATGEDPNNHYLFEKSPDPAMRNI